MVVGGGGGGGGGLVVCFVLLLLVWVGLGLLFFCLCGGFLWGFRVGFFLCDF